MKNSSVAVVEDLIFAPDELEDLWASINHSPTDALTSLNLIFAVFGTLSNFMSVIVLLKLSSQLSTFVYLTSLSLSDLLTCLTLMSIEWVDLSLHTRRTMDVTIVLRRLEIFVGALAAGSRVLSLWISLAVTIDRWILICYPVYSKRFCRLQHARLLCLVLFLLALIYSIPLIFEYEIIRIPSVHQMLHADADSSEASLLITKGYSDLGKRRSFRWCYMFFNLIFVYLLPSLSIVTLNIQLIGALHRLKSRRKDLKRSNRGCRRHRRRRGHSKYSVTILVITMVCTLLVCRSPTFVLWILWSFESTIKIFFHSSFSVWIRRFHRLANLIALINAATNFIPFCVFGQLFRHQCLNIYCCRRPTSEQLARQARNNYRENCREEMRRQVKQTTNVDQVYLHAVPSLNSDSISGWTAPSSCEQQSTNVLRLSDPPVAASGTTRLSADNPIPTSH